MFNYLRKCLNFKLEAFGLWQLSFQAWNRSPSLEAAHLSFCFFPKQLFDPLHNPSSHASLQKKILPMQISNSF